MRDTLFISHATPDDVEFTIWIASRLELMGYKIWIDKEGLLGGERFWKEILSLNLLKLLKTIHRQTHILKKFLSMQEHILKMMSGKVFSKLPTLSVK